MAVGRWRLFFFSYVGIVGRLGLAVFCGGVKDLLECCDRLESIFLDDLRYRPLTANDRIGQAVRGCEMEGNEDQAQITSIDRWLLRRMGEVWCFEGRQDPPSMWLFLNRLLASTFSQDTGLETAGAMSMEGRGAPSTVAMMIKAKERTPQGGQKVKSLRTRKL